MKYYKITNETETHHGMVYKTGLNVDPNPFNPSGSCMPGGIYFSREDILAFLSYGIYVREVTLPEDALVYKNPGSPRKWKANKVMLGERRLINAETIRALIEEGADVDVNYGEPIRLASRAGNLEIVNVLLEHGANVHDKALYNACAGGHSEIVAVLLEHGATVYDGMLLNAIRSGCSQTVRLLIANGANVNYQNALPIREASESGFTDILDILLEAGADMGVGGYAALRSAVIARKRRAVDLLLDRGVKVDTSDIYLLRSAIQRDHPRLVKIFLDDNACYESALEEAAYHGYYDIVKLLVEHGFSTAGVSLRFREARVVKLLLEYGATANYGDVYHATRAGNYETAELLRKHLEFV